MKRIDTLFFSLFFLIIYNTGHAQEKSKIDSLKNLINNTTSDKVKCVNMYLLADQLRRDNPDEALKMVDASLAIAKNKSYKEYELNDYVLKGVIYTLKGEIDSAYGLYQLVIKYENDTALAYPVGLAYMSLINYYRQKGELKPALESALKAEKFLLPLKRKNHLIAVYGNIAGIFFDLNDFDKALKYDFKSIYLAKELNFYSFLPQSYSNIASTYGEKKMPDSAMFYLRKSLALAIENNNFEIEFAAYQAIGFEFYDADKLDSARYYFLLAKNGYEKASYFDETYPTLYGYLGMLETKQKNYPLALSYLTKADSIGVSLAFLMDRIEVKKALTELYAAMGDWEKAFASQEEFVLLTDSMQRDENIQITRELEGKYNTAKKEKENAILKANGEVQEQKLSAKNNMLIAAISGIALLGLLLFFIFKNYRTEKNHVVILDKLNLQLTHQRDEILNINQLLQLKVLRTQMNPHFIYNCLNAINNLVTKGENENASNYLVSFAKLLRMILDFSDNTFIDLEDEIKFIKLYLSLEAMRMGNDFSYEVKISDAMLNEDIGVPSLIIQPFIENAIWHGLINKEGDKKLLIHFEQNSNTDRVTCTVDDNGIGREKASEVKRKNNTMMHESKGIKITQERIELLKYQIKNDVSISITDISTPENELLGTRVELVLPTNARP
jgi:tetratricopeptide (TPR) repeat protein